MLPYIIAVQQSEGSAGFVECTLNYFVYSPDIVYHMRTTVFGWRGRTIPRVAISFQQYSWGTSRYASCRTRRSVWLRRRDAYNWLRCGWRLQSCHLVTAFENDVVVWQVKGQLYGLFDGEAMQAYGKRHRRQRPEALLYTKWLHRSAAGVCSVTLAAAVRCCLRNASVCQSHCRRHRHQYSFEMHQGQLNHQK